MKNLKKTLAIILILALCVPAFAESTSKNKKFKIKLTKLSSYAVANESKIKVQVKIVNGEAPYTVTVKYSCDGTVHTDTFTENSTGKHKYKYTPTKYGDWKVNVTVTDARGKSKNKSTTVPVAGIDHNRGEWVWHAMKVRKTGDWAKDIVAIALTQVGYKESQIDFVIDDHGSRQGWSIYGDWYGYPYKGWCSMFAAWCLSYAGISRGVYSYSSTPNDWASKLSWMNAYRTYLDSEGNVLYTPEPGDMIFSSHSGGSEPDHVGIVYKVEDDIIYSIDGNAEKRVEILSYRVGDKSIKGFGDTQYIYDQCHSAKNTEAPDVTPMPDVNDPYPVTN